MITRTISHYNILEVIGEGGMGIVYKARDLNLDRLVALKFLPHALTSDAQRAERLIHEARTASLLDHPNICTIHEFERTGDEQFFIVMAYCQGHTLDQLLEEGIPLPLERFLTIAGQIGQGLRQAHQNDIIHRDLKPSNLIVNNDNQVKILDFGLAGLHEEINQLNPQSMAGTPAYMSPEQLIGNHLDQRTDIWSFGVIMYQMLSGHPPFANRQAQELTYAILKDPPKPLVSLNGELPERLVSLVEKCLQKDPDERPQHIDEILDVLTDMHRKVIPAFPEVKKGHRNQILAVLFFIFLLFSGILAFLFHPFGADNHLPLKIAVLNFHELGTETDDNYFSHGVSEDIRSQLAAVHAFRIMSSQAVEDLEESELSISQIGKKLNVPYVLDGSIRRIGEDIRLVAQLFDVEKEEIQWTATYDRRLTDILQIQADIAGDIAAALQVQFTDIQKKRSVAGVEANSDAYNFYLHGRIFSTPENLPNLYESVTYFKKAIQLDPSYAPAYAGLAIVYIYLANSHNLSPALYDSAKVLCQQAIAIDSTCIDGYLGKGMVYRLRATSPDADMRIAYEAYKKALELSPGAYRTLLGMSNFLYFLGSYDQALDYLKQVLELNPKSAWAFHQMADIYSMQGEFEHAEKYYEKYFDISPADSLEMSKLYWQREDYDKLIKLINKQKKIYTNNHWYYHDVAVAYKNTANYDLARKNFEQAVQHAPEMLWHQIGLAFTYEEQGLSAQAMASMKITCERFPHNLMAWLNYSFLLARAGETGEAKKLMLNLLNDQNLVFPGVDSTMLDISKYYAGVITEKTIKQIFIREQGKIKRRSYFINTYYYLAMAKILNLGNKSVKTAEDTAETISYLKKYTTECTKDDVEYSLARIRLRELKGSWD